jgi:Ca2+-binding RTX toxin-like protein
MAKPYSGYFEALGQRESSGRYDATNSYGYLGKYQMGEGALIDSGYYLSDGTGKNDWDSSHLTGKDGVFSKADFLASPDAQENAIQTYTSLLWRYLGSAQQYEGQVIDGIKITISGLLGGSHLVGAGNVAKYLNSGGDTVPKDGNSVPVTDYIKLLGDYDTPFSYDHSKVEKLNGGHGRDVLCGYAGNDTLIGKGGNDRLYGGDGNDRLWGGAGNDVMVGGKGNDIFIFKRADLGGTDTITDFAKGDRFDFRSFDADTSTPGIQALTYLGGQAFTGSDGEMRIVKTTSLTSILVDKDGDGDADLTIRLKGKYALSAADFLGIETAPVAKSHKLLASNDAGHSAVHDDLASIIKHIGDFDGLV